MRLKNLQCVRCGRTYPPLPQSTTCQHCREDANRPGILDLVYEDHPILALKAIRASKGTAVTVTDEEMMSSIPLLAQKGRISAEPAGALALPGLKKLVKERKFSNSDRGLVIISGSGLKAPYSFLPLKASCSPQMEPSFSDFEGNLRGQ